MPELGGIPVGSLDPVSCRNKRCTITRAAMIKGSRKWKAKNRVRVALSTENPPQITPLGRFPCRGVQRVRL